MPVGDHDAALLAFGPEKPIDRSIRIEGTCHLVRRCIEDEPHGFHALYALLPRTPVAELHPRRGLHLARHDDGHPSRRTGEPPFHGSPAMFDDDLALVGVTVDLPPVAGRSVLLEREPNRRPRRRPSNQLRWHLLKRIKRPAPQFLAKNRVRGHHPEHNRENQVSHLVDIMTSGSDYIICHSLVRVRDRFRANPRSSTRAGRSGICRASPHGYGSGCRPSDRRRRRRDGF